MNIIVNTFDNLAAAPKVFVSDVKKARTRIVLTQSAVREMVCNCQNCALHSCSW